MFNGAVLDIREAYVGVFPSVRQLIGHVFEAFSEV
jgi:hypothetical protein